MSALRPAGSGAVKQNALPPLSSPPQPPKPAQLSPATQMRPAMAAGLAAASAPKPASAASSPAPSPKSATSASAASTPKAAVAATPPKPAAPSPAPASTPKGSSTARSAASPTASTPKSTSLNLLQERSAAKKDLPLNVKMVLQKRPEMYADPMFAHNYPVEVWEHYDVNKDGILNKNELQALAKDLVDRIVSMCKDSMRTQMPKSSDADLDKLIKKELPHILPAKTMEESRKVMAEHIYRELDIDKDGVVTRTEFFFNWQSVAQKVLDVNKVKQEALACAIL